MSNIAQFADLRGPRGVLVTSSDTPEKVCISAADTATHDYDLSSVTYFNSSKYQDRIVTIVSESAGDIWYFWSDNASDTVDKTASGSGATVAAYLPTKTLKDEIPSGRYLHLQAASAGLVRVWISNQTK